MSELNKQQCLVLTGLSQYAKRRIERHCRLRDKWRAIGKPKLEAGHDAQALLWLKRLLAVEAALTESGITPRESK